jgi:hypothetical protein
MSPRVREESVHPRLQLGASGRPLNFTVRGHEEATAEVPCIALSIERGLY